MTIITRKSRYLAFILPLFMLLGLGVVLAEGEMLNRSLVSSSGGVVSQNGLTLHSATGQPVAGAVGNDLLLCSGYWCGSGAPASQPELDRHIFLPFVVRQMTMISDEGH